MPCMNNMLPVLITKNVPQKDNMFNSNGNMGLGLCYKDRDFEASNHIFLVKSNVDSLI